MSETTFERVRRVAVESSEKELDPNTVTPDSTLGGLGLMVHLLGPILFLGDLEDDLRGEIPSFQFPFVQLGDERFDDGVTLQQIVELVDGELERLTTVLQR